MYGLRVDDMNHPQVQDGERIVRELTFAAIPGSYLADSFPILKYVPDWMPGDNFKRRAKFFVEMQSSVINLPFSDMLHNLVSFLRPRMPNVNQAFQRSGQGSSSMAAKLYSKLPSREAPNYEQQLETAKNAAAINFLGMSLICHSSLKTKHILANSWCRYGMFSPRLIRKILNDRCLFPQTVSSILTFILAMVLHPEVVKKAHEEIDSVVGSSRLPDFGDKDKLVYITAVVKETLRWQAVTPIGTSIMPSWSVPILTSQQVFRICSRKMMNTRDSSFQKGQSWSETRGQFFGGL